MIELLARLARPWADVYAQSSALQTTLTFLHLAGIFLGGGFAIKNPNAKSTCGCGSSFQADGGEGAPAGGGHQH